MGGMSRACLEGKRMEEEQRMEADKGIGMGLNITARVLSKQ